MIISDFDEIPHIYNGHLTLVQLMVSTDLLRKENLVCHPRTLKYPSSRHEK